MAKLKLYGKGSSRSFRCVWAAEEAGLAYDYINVEFGSRESNGTASTEYRGMNSQGKVPTLVVENIVVENTVVENTLVENTVAESSPTLVLSESAAIVNYIARLSTQQNLIPSSEDLSNVALYEQLAFFVLSDLEQPLWTCGKHKFAIPKEHRVPDVIATTYWEFEKSQKALLALIPDVNNFALGTEFTAADILIAHTLAWAESFKYELLPELKSYKDRMYEREACKRAVELVSA